jgi:hypothetical protein
MCATVRRIRHLVGILPDEDVKRRSIMLIRCGYTVALDTFGPTPMVLLLNARPERHLDLHSRETITFDPPVPARPFRDPFGKAPAMGLSPSAGKGALPSVNEDTTR